VKKRKRRKKSVTPTIYDGGQTVAGNRNLKPWRVVGLLPGKKQPTIGLPKNNIAYGVLMPKRTKRQKKAVVAIFGVVKGELSKKAKGGQSLSYDKYGRLFPTKQTPFATALETGKKGNFIAILIHNNRLKI
jgi:hypothetical protein